MRRQQRFAPSGPLAVHPQALGFLFDVDDQEHEVALEDGVAVIQIEGPLMHRAHFWFDSYEAIEGRVADAIAAGAERIVLDIDSPGGLAAGCFDCARELRRLTTEAGVELVAYVGGYATSAAYALATAASRIGVSSSATLGSIGVLGGLRDITKLLSAEGINWQVLASGARKGDGHPAKPIDDEMIAAAQSQIDGLAAQFFELVADHGWGGSVETIRSLEAAVVLGKDAVRLGLASELATLDQMKSATEAEGDTPMEMSELIASLQLKASSSDPEEARRARAALAAMEDEESEDETEDEEAEGDEDEEAEDETEDEEAEGDEDEEEAEDESDEEKAALRKMAIEAHVRAHKAEKKAAGLSRRDKKDRLLASRKDLSTAFRAVLKTASYREVKAALAEIDRGNPEKQASKKKALARQTAASAATPTRGAGQGTGRGSRLSPSAKAELDARMGLTKTVATVEHTPFKQRFGVRKPAPASAE